jgi:hypothetical protein
MSVDRAIGVGSPSRRELPAPVRAQSILLSTHQLMVEEQTVTDSRPAVPALSPAAVLYGFVGVDGVPYLVSFGGEDLRPGPVLAVATALDDDLGELQVRGELGEWIYPSADIRVADVLQEHRDCMVEPARDLMEVLRIKVAPIRVTAVWTRPLTDPSIEPVDLARFAAAEADPWAAFGHEAARHLNQHHHDELLALARDAGARGCTAVSLTRLDAAGVILTAMGPEGLMDVVLPFDPPAANPGEATRRLTGGH